MISSILLAAASVPATPVWSPTVAIIISVSSLVALLLTAISSAPKVRPSLPLVPITIPAFIGAMAFGHVVGVGIVLGLANSGRL